MKNYCTKYFRHEIFVVVNVLIPHMQEVLMNIRVPKSPQGYKAIAETFGQRYVCTCTCMYVATT